MCIRDSFRGAIERNTFKRSCEFPCEAGMTYKMKVAHLIDMMIVSAEGEVTHVPGERCGLLDFVNEHQL
eukprot:6983075-Prorocentrum_lima.AAC.1